jgi:hypothetical protein
MISICSDFNENNFVFSGYNRIFWVKLWIFGKKLDFWLHTMDLFSSAFPSIVTVKSCLYVFKKKVIKCVIKLIKQIRKNHNIKSKNKWEPWFLQFPIIKSKKSKSRIILFCVISLVFFLIFFDKYYKWQKNSW